MTNKAENIDEYISVFPEETQQLLQQVRTTIKKVVPEAIETISYAMPAFKLNKDYLVYFAGYKNHIGLYPTPVASEAFKEELAGYKTGKGSVQFPLSEPIPFDLIERIVKFRLHDIKAKTKATKTGKK